MPRWLGLVTSHRRLFDASQDGWLRPLPHSCSVLGDESFVSEELPSARNVVPVRLAFEVDKLPFPAAWKVLERGPAGENDGDEPRIVHWSTPIPLYAVKSVEVPSIEQKTRLLGMAGQLSNVSLPSAEVAVSDFLVHSPATGGTPLPEKQWLELPETLNAVQGAMTMAVWAVPRVEPWIEILQQSLGRSSARVVEVLGRLNAQWLQLPWLQCDLTESAWGYSDDQKELWRAALRCMQWPSVGNTSPGALAAKIAHAVSREGTNRPALRWLDQTLRIVAAEEPITCEGWRRNGAGLAIRLALLRPDPMKFRSWNKDLPGLPPAVWWAAATLCGWRHGYRALDKKFRGDATLQEFLATRALAASSPSGDAATLPLSQRSSLEQRYEMGCFTLNWRGSPVLRKPWQSRAKWYDADPD